MKLAIFDFDGTLFPKDTLPYLLNEWKHLGYPRGKYYKTLLRVIVLYIKYKTGIGTKMTREQMRAVAMEKFNYIFTDLSEEEVLLFFQRATQDIIPLLRPSVLDELMRAKQEEYHVVLLSGAYCDLMECISKYIPADTSIGTEMFFENGMFDYEHEIEVVSGKRKLERVLSVFSDASINWEKSIAYADSYSDLEILEAVGTAYVVEPDEKLKQIAKEKNWKMIA